MRLSGPAGVARRVPNQYVEIRNIGLADCAYFTQSIVVETVFKKLMSC